MGDSAKNRLAKPTDAELAILRVLWNEGPSTVRQVHEHLGGDENAGYTTILKLMQIMFEKKLVLRDDRQRAHIYRAKIAAADTEQRLVRDLLNRVFGGAADQLVLRALNAKPVSAEELTKIRQILDEVEKRK